MVELHHEQSDERKQNIKIDDIDISELGLHFLRKSLSIIPQTPVMFIGTIRYNIDPLGHYQDDQIW